MKNKVMNQSDRDSLLVRSFKQQANKESRNRTVRVNELRRVAASLESEHGRILKFEAICSLIVNSLESVKERNSFGYIEVTDLLEDAIRYVRTGR